MWEDLPFYTPPKVEELGNWKVTKKPNWERIVVIFFFCIMAFIQGRAERKVKQLHGVVFCTHCLLHFSNPSVCTNLTYTPVIKHSNGKSPFSIGNTYSKGSFSIAMLDYQRVRVSLLFRRWWSTAWSVAISSAVIVFLITALLSLSSTGATVLIKNMVYLAKSRIRWVYAGNELLEYVIYIHVYFYFYLVYNYYWVLWSLH